MGSDNIQELPEGLPPHDYAQGIREGLPPEDGPPEGFKPYVPDNARMPAQLSRPPDKSLGVSLQLRQERARPARSMY